MTPLPKPPKKRWYKRVWIWLLLILALLVGGGLVTQQAVQQLTAPIDTAQQSVVAEVRTLTKVVNSTGKITPEYTQPLGLAVTSEVTEVKVAVGDDVEDGDVLVKTGLQQLKAPFDGRVLAIHTFVGSTPQPGEAVIEIGYRNNFIDVLASESEVFDIVTGQRVDITIPSYDNGASTYDGTVELVARKKITTTALTSQTSAESGYLVRIRPNDLPDAVNHLIDLTVNVTIHIDERTDVLSVERAAIQYDDADAPYVTLASGEQRSVSTGFEGDDYIEIISGLQTGDEVLLNIPKAETASPF